MRGESEGKTKGGRGKEVGCVTRRRQGQESRGERLNEVEA